MRPLPRHPLTLLAVLVTAWVLLATTAMTGAAVPAPPAWARPDDDVAPPPFLAAVIGARRGGPAYDDPQGAPVTGGDRLPGADRSGAGPPGAPLVAYDWPTGGPVPVLAPFEGSATRYGPGHRGVDLDVRPGAVVLAAADGVVAFSGMVAGRPVVSIDHADGLRTTYEPVEGLVTRGEEVASGQRIGTVTAGHCPPPGCLHWGARRGTHDYVDPLSLLRDGPLPVRLLPVDG